MQWDKIGDILAAVQGRWAIPVMRHLATGNSRPADLQKAVSSSGGRLSAKVMFEVLRRLGSAGLVHRTEISGAVPRETHYFLSSTGREILTQVSKLGSNDSGWMMEQDSHPSPGVDLARAHPARVWDYWLGGKDNFPADREAADKAIEALPSMREIARASRRYQGRAVRALLERGVRQFLDIGTGLPAPESIHEITRREALPVRIVYVDNDPLVVTHARALLKSSHGSYSYIEADLREPGKILAHASQTLDLSQPVAVLLIGVLHFIPDAEDPWAIITRLLAGIGGDVYVVIGHGASDISPERAAEMSARYNARSAVEIRLRSRTEVGGFFAGTEMLDPGLVPLGQWPTPEVEPNRDADLAGWVGIGRRGATQASVGGH